MNLVELLLSNLMITGLAMLFLVGGWLANFSLSLYYNIQLLKEPFDWNRIKDGVLKLLAVLIGTTMLVMVITYIPVFIQYIGLAIPDEYILLFNVIAIVAVIFEAVYLYVGQAYEKFNNIIHSQY